ncbi:MAG: M48 family peptidase, partial [Candidatus Electrothrix sp. AR3]|nr:M48 family peptidase [Candidatus Electrothrix sp. AR3]
MNPYLIFILTALIAGWLVNLIVSLLEVASLQTELPLELNKFYDQEKYRKSQQYTKVKAKFSQLSDSIMLIVTLIFILAGGFNFIDLAARRFGLGTITTGLLFIGGVLLLSSLASLPFSVYSTFVIEERFGFNKTSPKTFFLDLLKAVLLSLVLGTPLLAALLWFFQSAGSTAWLYCWGAMILFILLLQFLAPVLIMPLFNKFIPLEAGALRDAITQYAEEQHFAIQGIYTMDGSKRSTRLNAFFTQYAEEQHFAIQGIYTMDG